MWRRHRERGWSCSSKIAGGSIVSLGSDATHPRRGLWNLASGYRTVVHGRLSCGALRFQVRVTATHAVSLLYSYLTVHASDMLIRGGKEAYTGWQNILAARLLRVPIAYRASGQSQRLLGAPLKQGFWSRAWPAWRMN